jgi:hypothetical protein
MSQYDRVSVPQETLDKLDAKISRAKEALEFVLEHGKVLEGEGIWLGHSGQIKIEKALAFLLT